MLVKGTFQNYNVVGSERLGEQSAMTHSRKEWGNSHEKQTLKINVVGEITHRYFAGCVSPMCADRCALRLLTMPQRRRKHYRTLAGARGNTERGGKDAIHKKWA